MHIQIFAPSCCGIATEDSLQDQIQTRLFKRLVPVQAGHACFTREMHFAR